MPVPLVYVVLVQFFRTELIKLYAPSFTEIPADPTHYITSLRLFAYAIPVVIALCWLARVLRQLVAKQKTTDLELESLVLYACSIQCLVLAPCVLLRPQIGHLTNVAFLYGLLASSFLLFRGITRQDPPRAPRAILTAVALSCSAAVCVVLFVAAGIAFEFLPAYRAHLQRQQQAEVQQQMAEVKTQLKPLLDKTLDEIDPDWRRREKVTLAIRDVQFSEDLSEFSCSALFTNECDNVIHLSRSLFDHQTSRSQYAAPRIITWPDSKILIIRPDETTSIALRFSALNRVTDGTKLSFQVPIEYFQKMDSMWISKAVLFGEFQFRVSDHVVTPAVVTAWGMNSRSTIEEVTRITGEHLVVAPRDVLPKLPLKKLGASDQDVINLVRKLERHFGISISSRITEGKLQNDSEGITVEQLAAIINEATRK